MHQYKLPRGIHTQQHVGGAHLPMPYSEALIQQREAGLKQCTLVKNIKSNRLEYSSQNLFQHRLGTGI